MAEKSDKTKMIESTPVEDGGRFGIPGMVKIIEWSPEDLNRGWKMFSNLLGFWQLKNSHK